VGNFQTARESVLSYTACRLSRLIDLSAQAQPRSRPEGGRRSARPTPQRAAWRRRARARKKDKIIIFSLHIVTGNGGLWQVSEAPKYFGGGVKKDKIFLPPPHSPPSLTPTVRYSVFPLGKHSEVVKGEGKTSL
jgi:hypothetical protein